MGFTRGIATTTNTMFVNYGFEQEISNVERDPGAIANLQIGAVNELVKSLKIRGIDPAKVINTEDFELEIIYWCLMTMYAGETPSAMPGQSKHSHYMKMWTHAVQNRVIVIDLGDGTTETITPDSKGLPKVQNLDKGAFFRGSDNNGENDKGTLGGQYDKYVRNRKDPSKPGLDPAWWGGNGPAF